MREAAAALLIVAEPVVAVLPTEYVEGHWEEAEVVHEGLPNRLLVQMAVAEEPHESPAWSVVPPAPLSESQR